MKTICMLTNLFPPVATGSSTQCYALSKELVKQGHKVIVITAKLTKEIPAEEILDGIIIYRIPAIRLPKLSIALNFNWLNLTMIPTNHKKMESIIKQHQVDVLHVHNHMFDMALNGVRLSRKFNVPIVLTMHTIIKHANPIFNLILYPLDRFFLKSRVLNKVNSVICPDYNMEGYVRERFDRGNSDIIPYGIELPKNPPANLLNRIREKYNLKNKRVILSLGHLHALRNRIDLIKALPEIVKRFPNLVLLIVGNIGSQRAVELVKSLHLEDNVIFTGSQPHDLIPAFHSIAELEAMWFDQAKEGMNPLGIACMEAMFYGKVILTVSNQDTFGKNILENGKNVILLKAGRPDLISKIICELLENPEKIQEIGNAAKGIAEKYFAWDKVVRNTLDVYSKASIG